MKNYLWIWRLLVVLLLVGSPAMGSAAKRKAIPQLPKGDMGKKKKDVEEAAGPASLRQYEQSQFDDRVKRLQKRKSVARQKQIQNMEKMGLDGLIAVSARTRQRGRSVRRLRRGLHNPSFVTSCSITH